MILRALIGDITNMEVDAIVNAAHPSLEGGGGVDGAVHRAAGHQLIAACLKLPVLQRNEIDYEDDPREANVRCPTGHSKITPGFNLPSKYVIHTAGPRQSDENARGLLSDCYRSSLQTAAAYECKSIAYPAISTGVFGYPLEAATIIAVNTVIEQVQADPKSYDDMEVIFVCFDEANFLVYDRVLDAARRGWETNFNTRTHNWRSV